jgi:hypothetical protein
LRFDVVLLHHSSVVFEEVVFRQVIVFVVMLGRGFLVAGHGADSKVFAGVLFGKD